MAYQHGVYIVEQSTSLTTPTTGTAGLQVVIGTAPVHLAENPYACTNTPVLVSSFAEAAQKLGDSSDFDAFTLCQAVDASFRCFAVAPLVLINVLDPTIHIKPLSETTVAVSDGTAMVLTENVLLDKLKVTLDGTALTQGADYTAAFSGTGYPIITVLPDGAAADAASLTVSGTCIDPSKVTQTDVIGGVHPGTGQETGLEVIRQVFPKLGLTPGLLLAPGWSHKAEVAAALQGKCESLNGLFGCECVVDLDTAVARRYDEVLAAKTACGMRSSHAIAVWPKVAVGSKVYYYSALYGALAAYTTAREGDVPAVSPSNQSLPITALVGADGVEITLDLAQANQVNAAGVVTALHFSGGFVSWGNNTAAYPGDTDPKNRWISVRRFFTWWGNSFILTYFQRVDDPANPRLIESVVDSENIRGNSFVARGYCAEARITFAEAENPTTQIMDGKIVFHQYLAPYTPAECIQNILEFNPQAIQSAMAGG